MKLRWQNSIFGVDAFTGGVVYNDHNNFNKANSQDVFSGLYFNFPTALSNEIVEAYVYDRTVSRGITTDNWSGVAAPFRFPAPQDLYTWGLRIKSKLQAAIPRIARSCYHAPNVNEALKNARSEFDAVIAELMLIPRKSGI